MLEALAAAAIVMTISLVLDPSAPGGGPIHPHLMWIAVLVLAAQYGLRGLAAGLTAGVVGLVVASLSVNEGLGWLPERAANGAEILAFVGATVVALVAGGHERRKAALAATAAARAAEADSARSAFGELRSVADALVRQSDRAEHSVTYLRSVAARIEGEDPASAADAALELALGRVEAGFGAIFLHDGKRLRRYAHRGTWSEDGNLPPDVYLDRTADQAFRQDRPTTSFELDETGPHDSELAVPIPGRDRPCGVLVVHDLAIDLELASMERFDRTLFELVAIARWVSRPISEAAKAAQAGAYSFSFRPGERRDLLPRAQPHTNREDPHVG